MKDYCSWLSLWFDLRGNLKKVIKVCLKLFSNDIGWSLVINLGENKIRLWRVMFKEGGGL